MSIEIPADLEQFVQHAVASGKYRSREEVISAALALLRTREEKLDALRGDLQIGLEQLVREEFTDISSSQDRAALVERIGVRGSDKAPLAREAEEQLDRLRKDIQLGMDGAALPADEVFARLEQRARSLAERRP